MALIIQPYQPEHESAVEAFNARLQRGVDDPNLVFYRNAQPKWLPKGDGSNTYQEFFVAVDGSMVRGAYVLKHQPFIFPDGSIESVGYYHHPLAEGIVDKTYAMVGALLLRDAMMRAPLLYCLGMGGYDRPLPKMLIALGWPHFLIPFYFKVLQPTRFLREMQALRTSPLRKLLMDAGAVTGAGWIGGKAFEAYCNLRGGGSTASAEAVESFSDWVDEIWNQTERACSHGAVRDARALQRLYPSSLTHLTRLRVKRGGRDIGWAVVGERRRDSKYGNMRVGSLLDAWSLVGEEGAVVQAATHVLREQNFDLILTNQSHASWCEALRTKGYLAGPSNFIYAASKKLAERLAPFAEQRPRFHFTRADGDGLPQNY